MGGIDQPITVVARQPESITRELFQSTLFTDHSPAIPVDAAIAANNNAVAEQVNTDPSAIGYVSHAFTRGAAPITLINDCGLVSRPDAFSAKTEEYLFQRHLHMYTRSDNTSEIASDFVRYAASHQADQTIAKAGFVDFGIATKIQTRDGFRAHQLKSPSKDPFEGVLKHDMLTQLPNYERLSTTFRFAHGTTDLDARAAIDMTRLADYVSDLPYGTRVMFAGFTDDSGDFVENHSLSNAWAKDVLAAFAAHAGGELGAIELSHTGFGELAPTACNTTEQGRALNRRVEVWVSRATS